MPDAIARLRAGHIRAVLELPPTRVAERQTVVEALCALGLALDEINFSRRDLARKLLTLQGVERAAIPRDLHDEPGQPPSTMWLDLSDLQREPSDAGRGKGAVAEIARSWGWPQTTQRMCRGRADAGDRVAMTEPGQRHLQESPTSPWTGPSGPGSAS